MVEQGIFKLLGLGDLPIQRRVGRVVIQWIANPLWKVRFLYSSKRLQMINNFVYYCRIKILKWIKINDEISSRLS